MVKRIVTGAHYGSRDWLAQRVTGALMAVYIVILLVVFMTGTPVSYAVWKDIFAQGWLRVATLLFAASLAWHAWVGMRDVVMDYVKPDGLRLALQVGIVLLLAGYLAWAVQILWR
jgi:succinate dehydrogenase / fumarate reductase membrane anchor subunit